MAIGDVLDDAYGAEVRELYGTFFDAVAAAKDKDSEMAAAAERFRMGIELLKRVHAKAKEIATP